jgi:hypothetical protein
MRHLDYTADDYAKLRELGRYAAAELNKRMAK